MKIRRPIQRKAVPPKTKPKRLDLNPRQQALLRKIEGLSQEEVASFEAQVVSRGNWYLGPTYVCPEGDRYYHPTEVALYLGWSAATVENYTDRYLRLVRREGETAKEFRARKAKADRADAPLVSRLKHEVDAEGAYRLISPRVLMFVVLAPTQVRGEHRDFIRELRQISTLPPGKAQPIGATSSVTRWEVEK